jgi:predicted GNAT family acetyltransferase
MGDDVKLDEAIPSVIDNRDASRFELTVDGHTGVLVYKRTPSSLVLVHTEVSPAIRGRHFGDTLVKAAIDAAHAEGLRIVAVCPFVKAYLRKHPQS